MKFQFMRTIINPAWSDVCAPCCEIAVKHCNCCPCTSHPPVKGASQPLTTKES